jgi:hypothetical protein
MTPHGLPPSVLDKWWGVFVAADTGIFFVAVRAV